MNQLDKISDSFFKLYRDSKSFAGEIDYYKARNYIVEREDLAYTSLIEGIEGMRKEFEPAKNIQIGGLESDVWELIPDEKGMYCLNCKRFTPEEGCLCGWVSLDDIIENVVKPLYGKTTGDK